MTPKGDTTLFMLLFDAALWTRTISICALRDKWSKRTIVCALGTVGCDLVNGSAMIMPNNSHFLTNQGYFPDFPHMWLRRELPNFLMYIWGKFLPCSYHQLCSTMACCRFLIWKGFYHHWLRKSSLAPCYSLRDQKPLRHQRRNFFSFVHWMVEIQLLMRNWYFRLLTG